MKKNSRTALLAAILVLAAISGCQKKNDNAGAPGPAEKAGAQIDSAAEKAGTELNKAGEKMGQALQEGGKKLEDKAKDAENKK